MTAPRPSLLRRAALGLLALADWRTVMVWPPEPQPATPFASVTWPFTWKPPIRKPYPSSFKY